MQMRVLVLGGTGAMGTYLVKILAAKGINTDVTTRKIRKSGNSLVRYIQGNAHERRFVAGLLEEPYDAVVDFMLYGTEEFRERAELLLEGTKQYIFLSSARVYAESKDPITEDSPRLLDVCVDRRYLSTEEYALAKARQENVLFGSKNKNWTIIRPYITYSNERLQLGVFEKENWLYRALQGRPIVFSEDIAGKVTTLTCGYDVAAAIAELIGNSRALGEAFHIAVGKPLRWGQILAMYQNAIEEATGNRPEVHWTGKALDTGAVGNEAQLQFDRLYDRVFDNSKIYGIIGRKGLKNDAGGV